jgi:arylsulfatase A-like enzyme
MDEKRPNILFIVIDSLRSDRILTNQKFAVIPNIEKLSKEGTKFTQLISTSDVTGTCLGSVFSGSYPFKTRITQTNMDDSKMIFFKILKKNGYRLSAVIPKFTLIEKIIKNFDEKFIFDHTEWKEKETIFGINSTKILDFFSKNSQKNPWFHYLHLIDIHGFGSLVKIPEKFDDEKFGKTKYDKLLSAVDFWIKEVLSKVSMENTMIVITSDHGEYVPNKIENIESKSDFRDMPNFYKIMRMLKKKFPKLQFLGDKIFVSVLTLNEKIKMKSKKIDMEKDKQFIPRGFTKYLYDDAIKIPLIISGYKTPKNLIVNRLTRQIDIFPTILGLMGIKNDEVVDGRNIFDVIKNDEDEVPAYIEVGSSKPKTLGKSIGIRTSTYKYFRNRFNNKLDVYLFDLINDPSEMMNIESKKPDIVKEYEEKLEEILENSTDSIKGEVTDEEKQIEDELRKMGYL